MLFWEYFFQRMLQNKHILDPSRQFEVNRFGFECLCPFLFLYI